MPVIKRVEPKFKAPTEKKKVAAYARVSRDSERLLHSFSAQVSYYSQLIQNNPEWEYAGVYSDEAITGTLIRKRDGFKQMIADCEAGKIDIVLTKSIQRFARNTVDLLNSVRHLRELGIEVIFEKEHIHTLSGDGELMLSILASFAQEEVRNLSENVRWARKKKIDQGESPIRMQVTGYDWDGDQLVINEEEAKIIRRIFAEYLAGNSPTQICKHLKADGIKTIRGHWFQPVPVYKILQNPLYKGVLLLQKTYIEDPITKVQRFNHGELPMVMVEDNHEPIIDPSTFDEVQEEMKRRKEAWESGEYDFFGRNIFTWKVKCGKTGKAFNHSVEPGGEYWRCVKVDCPYKDTCQIKGIPELALLQLCRRVGVEEDEVIDKVENITIPEDGELLIRLKDGTEKYDIFRSYLKSVEKQPKNQNCFSKKIVCGMCGRHFTTQSGFRPSGVRRVVWYCKDGGHNACINENVLKFRIKESLGWDVFTFQRFRDEVDHIEMTEPYLMKIVLKNGETQTTEYYGEERKRWKHGKEDNGNTCDKE